MYPGCKIGPDVEIGANVTIQVSNGGSITIGARSVIKPNVSLICKRGTLAIGDDVFIGPGCVVCSNESVVISNDCLIGEYVTIRDQNHGTETTQPFRVQPMATEPILVSENVWIGAKATILGGVTIGHSSIVGAHSLVNKDVADKTVVGGVPAKTIRNSSD